MYFFFFSCRDSHNRNCFLVDCMMCPLIYFEKELTAIVRSLMNALSSFVWPYEVNS